MSAPVHRKIVPLPEFTSAEVSLYVAQLEELTQRLRDDVKDMTPEELEWQPAPGTNTIGMLLAHLAIVEVFWVSVLVERAFLCDRVLGIGADDDGLPLPDGAAPPQNLAGKPLSWYFELLMKSRAYVTAQLTPLTAADLTKEIEHRGSRGTRLLNGHWILYHVLEHFGGHYGQILLLRHLRRAGVRAPDAAADHA